MSKRKPIPSELVDALHLPHLSHAGGKWMKKGAAPRNDPGFARQRLIFYAKQLLDLGMPDADVSGLLADLYWDSYEEACLNNTFDILSAKKKRM